MVCLLSWPGRYRWIDRPHITRTQDLLLDTRQLLTTPHPTTMFARATRPLYRSLAPLGDRILIRRAEKEVKTASGILLPTDKGKDPNEGVVVAVGPGLRDVSGVLHAPTVKAGDTVLLPKYGGTDIEIGDEKMSLFREEDILGKFE